MIQEKIQKKAEGFGKLASVFLEGAEYALNIHWINVKEDLPCNHEELLNLSDKRYTLYMAAIIHSHITMSRMYELDGKWYWENDEPTHWLPIPKLPK